ncbi:MAG: hypothetical protein ACTSUS_03575, partial [Candidatus Freyarchaeota archaeon]
MKALDLRRQGPSYSDIKKILKAELQWSPSKSELSEWLRKIHTTRKNHSVRRTPTRSRTHTRPHPK